MSKVKVIRQPTAEETLILNLRQHHPNFWLRILRMVMCMHHLKKMRQKSRVY